MITSIDMKKSWKKSIYKSKTKKLKKFRISSFLWKDEICTIRILLSNTTLVIKSSSNISNLFDTKVGSPQKVLKVL